MKKTIYIWSVTDKPTPAGDYTTYQTGESRHRGVAIVEGKKHLAEGQCLLVQTIKNGFEDNFEWIVKGD